jgi:K+ transporter
MVVVTLKYVLLILRADNRGEGGIMALTAWRRRRPARHQRAAPRSCSPACWARRCSTATA